MIFQTLRPIRALANVRYEIRGPLGRAAPALKAVVRA